MSRMTGILIRVSIVVFLASRTRSDWKEDAEAIDISGGEHHTLVLTKNKWPWACGPNSWWQLGVGNNTDPSLTLARVLRGDMNSVSDYLEDINDVDADHNGIHEPNEGYLENIVSISAGYWHSLAIDANGTVWTWGRGSEGRRGLVEDVPIAGGGVE